MSSVTFERQKRAACGPTGTGKKIAPITRHEHDARSWSLAEIGKPGGCVMAMPAGGNERFAKADVQSARSTIDPENLMMFEELLECTDMIPSNAAEALARNGFDPWLHLNEANGCKQREVEKWLR